MKNLWLLVCFLCIGISLRISTGCSNNKNNLSDNGNCFENWKTLDPSVRQSILETLADSITDSDINYLSSKLGLERTDTFTLNAFKAFKGDTVSKKDAMKFTTNYYNTNAGYTVPKSVYFNLDSIYKFISAYKFIPNQIACQDSPAVKGIRLYFAEYPNDYGGTVNPNPRDVAIRNKHHIILRLTCNKDDLVHDNPWHIPVAYNFGDVCPPMCDPLDDTAFNHCGGKYDTLALSPQYGVCPKFLRQ